MLHHLTSTISSIEEIVTDLKNKKMVILIDDENRENEGDLIFPAEMITPEIVNFMSQNAKGLICVAISEEVASQLDLPQMISEQDNRSKNKTAFTVSVEAASGVTTGISAADRSRTIRVLANPQSTSKDLIRPGHIFPIRAQKGGVLKRAGHTEASVDLCKIAGLRPVAVICEIINQDGTMARLKQLKAFAHQHEIKIGTIEDLIQYRVEHDSFIEKQSSFDFKTRLGQGFKVHTYFDPINELQHFAFVKGSVSSEKATLVRMHTECVAGDIFDDLKTNSRNFLEKAFSMIDKEGTGVIVYLKSHLEPARSFQMSQSHPSSSSLDSKDYGIGAQILRSLGVKKMELITNSNKKRVGIKGYGLEIIGTRPLQVSSSIKNIVLQNKDEKSI